MAAVKELKHNYDEFNRTYGYRRIRPAYLYGFAGLLSLVWAGLIIYYARNSIYTSASLLKMLPHEFGGFLAGTIMPVGFIWMIAMYVDRNMNSNYEREVIYPFIQSIVDPHGDQGAIIAVIKQKISVESEALASLVSSMSSLYSQMEKTTREGKDSMEAAIAAATGYEGKLGLLTSELARASADLEGKATAMLDNLSENAARLASNSAITEEKAAAAAKGILAQTSALEYSLGQTLETTGRILDGVSAKKGELDATVEAALARTAEARDNLSQAGTVVQAAAGALETRAEQILAKVEDKTGQFIIKANISAEKISGVVANMEHSALSLASI
ncbi:MAG: hypothetical protein LBL52_03885, partial [Rickettsiales bacterium]|nr:hypothetical protein [Rickettsiales bacterium]